MERREGARRPRRVQVKFWARGETKFHRGYSANISTGGMYIDTNHLAPRDSRIRLEVCSGEQGFMVEATVVRVQKSLQSMRPSGMGVRFLEIAELVGELMPELGSTASPGEVPAGEPPLPPGSFRMRFADRRQFLDVYHRDLATGGLFIPTDEPAALHDVVTVELSVAGTDASPLRFQARVVHRLDPSMPDGSGGNLMAGMGVELLSFDQTLKSLASLVARLGG